MPDMIQTDHNGLLPPAGAVDGVNMTYHHIIPRNILCSWWNAMESRAHVGAAKGFIEALIDTTYARLGAGEKAPNPVPAYLTNNNGQYVLPNMLKSALPKFDNRTWKNATDGVNWDVFSAIFQWWPGNIHHGPTQRLTSSAAEWMADVDDGGDQFEVAAKLVIPEGTFAALDAACTAIKKYLDDATASKEQLPLLSTATSQLMAVAVLKNFHTYDKRRWYQVPTGSNQGRWRLKRSA